MNTHVSLTHRFLPGLCLAPLVLAGCASSGTYRRLVRDFDDGQQTAYYQEQTAVSPAAPPSATATEEDDFLNQVEGEIMDAKKRWEATLAAPGAGASAVLPENGGAAGVKYRELARDPKLSEHLAAGVSLETLLGLVPELHPGVHAAREDLRATLQQYPQAAYLDNILRQYNAFTKQLDTKIGPPRQKGMMAMSFPFPDALALKGRIVDEQVEIAQRQEEIALRDALTTMRMAYPAYIFVNEAIAINRENQDLLEQMIHVAQAKIRVDKAKYNAVIMAQVELSKLADDIITLEEQRETIIAKINALLSRGPDAALGPPQPVSDVDLDLSREELYKVAVRDRQELQQQRLRINRMDTMVELATRMAYPDPSTGASYLEDRMRLTAGTDQTVPGFMTQRDLNHRETPWFGQRDAYIREVRTKTDAMHEMLVQMEDSTRFQVKEAAFALSTAKRSIALYRESLLPQARQALEAARAGYRAGNTNFLTFLDTQRTLLRFRLAEQSALRDHRVQLARLEQLAGHTLPHRPLALAAGSNQ